MEEAIKEKQSHYASFGKKVDREGALDEIIADSTYEMIQSQDFTDMLCKENRSLAQSILNAIKNVIDKIRTMLKEGSSFTPKQNASLLSELDVLKEATKLWTDGLMVAAENRAAVGVSESKRATKKSNARYSSVEGKTYILSDSASVSYEALLNKGEIKGERIEKTYSADNDYELENVINGIIVNCSEEGILADGKTFINIPDVGENVKITKNGLRHGLVGKALSGKKKRKEGKAFKRYERNYNNANIGSKYASILKNSIVVNEINDRDGGLILMGYAYDQAKNQYVVRTILKRGADGFELENWDSKLELKAVNTKKREATDDKSSYSVSTDFSIIKIPEYLNLVKEVGEEFSDNLSLDVINKIGAERRDNAQILVRFSLPDEASVYDYVDEHETEFANMPSVRDYEAKAQRVKNQTYDELAEQVRKLSLDKRLTHGKILDESSVKEELNELVRLLMTYSESYAVDGSPRKVNSALVNMATKNASVIYKAIKEGEFAAASNVAYETAREIVENLEMVNDSAFVQYKELRSFLKTTKIEVSEAVKSDISDYNAWRKKQFGRLKLVKDGGVPVDAVYEELCEVYPELFDIELTHPTDQLMAIADAREALEPYDIMLSEEQTEQLIKQAAQDILDVAAIGKPWKSWADKKKEVYDEKIKALKAMHSEAVRDVKVKERLRATRMLNAEKVKARERADRKKDTEIRKRYMASIEKSRKWLTDMLVKPTDDKHIPEGFRAAVADLMAQVDMQSKKSQKIEQKRGSRAKRWVEMDELRARLSEIAKEDDSGNFEYDGYIFDIMGALAEKMAGKAIDEASTQQLHEFDILLKYIVTNVRNYNKAFSDNLKEGISALGNESINSAKNRQKKLKDGKYRDRSGLLGGVDSILNETMVTPRDFFELLGGGLNKAFLSMRKGFDKHVDNMSAARDFFNELFKPYRNRTAIRKKSKPGSAIEKWRNRTESCTDYVALLSFKA